MVEVAPERFEELVVEALDSIPEALGRYMDNVAVFVEDERRPGPARAVRGRAAHQASRRTGSPYNGLPMPDRITIFRLPICRMCADEAEVVRQVRITVVHEVAHHFGIDDDRLEELGWA